MHPLLVAIVVAAATWDAWRWYVARVSASPEEAVSLTATVIFLAVLGAARGPRPAAPRPLVLVQAAILLGVYVSSYALLPAILRAALAIAATLFAFHLALFKQRPPVAFWGLVALALPVVPSLQFVLGYPMRVVSATLAVGLLQAQGLAVNRQGTFLIWHGQMVDFDAPCSGVNMLWAGLLLTLMGCVLYRLGAIKVAVAIALSVALSIASNALRAASLFYVEAGFFAEAPDWWHDGIGLAAFIASSVATLWLLGWLRDQKPPELKPLSLEAMP
jgi:exosortase/archaeosortase family protein